MSDEKAYQKAIGTRLKAVRVKRGYPNRELFAADFGAPKKTFEKYEQGLSELPTKLLLWLQGTHNVNLTWLISGVGEMFDQPPGHTSALNPAVFKAVKSMVTEINNVAGIRLPDDARDQEAAKWYNELITMAKGSADEDKLSSLLPALQYEIERAVKSASVDPGSGKLAAS